ncbi:MAG: MarR family transcriptional regulator [Acidimicrobiales bacterium]|nr:MarR family transcriptional regulator [Acidimicrobiales bacterium]
MATKWLDERESDAWRLHLRAHGELLAELNRRLMRESGLSIADYGVLSNLSEAPDERLRTTELASAMNWERSRTSHHVTRMVGRDLVGRDECEDDGRGSFVVLTATGRHALASAAPGHAADVRELFIGPVGDRLDAVAAVSRATLEALASEG